MVTAKDLGGNVKVEGPHNLYIDPNSDLPISGITNPYPNMRVVANLNIVGVCVDDDAVSYVELVLDGDTENPIRAEGKEFWSYYLDTNNMEEGPHTVQVTGYDINGLPGKPVSVTYQLDRNQPLTTVADREMGMLVSGNVEFQGTVEDGNGIKELFYSTDNCETFIPVKISNGKPLTNFKFNVNSKNFPDGPAVIWFKATDMSGSTGMYSFLYFIDNTKPDVQIVSPTVDEVVNGKITVAGFAKDTNGIVDLRWTFGEESGVIELVPGNPYWVVDLDTTNGKDKNKKFVIHAEDRAGNVVEVAQQINLNQELDKPVVTILSPVAAQDFGDDQDIVLRGIAKDDDGVVSIKYQLDSEEPVVQETKGVFDVVLLKGKDLNAGKHKVTVSAVDVNGVEGNPVVVEFNSLFTAPVFENPEVALGKEIVPFVNGIEIHPESGSSISVKSSSQVGIKSVYTKLSWGSEGVIENTKELKNVMNHTEVLAINPDSPKGVVHYTVTVTDTADRNSSFKGIFYVTNTNKLSRDEPIVVFDDSTVAEDGGIICNPEFPATGYFLGANAASVELVPPTPFAKAELEGNQIKLIPQNAIGSSAKVVVRVKTDKGKTFDSREIFFKNDNVLPEITINDYSDSFARVIDNEVDTNVVIKGNVKCQTGVGSLKYRILSTRVEIKNAVIASVKNNPIPDSYGDVEVNKDGSFELDINTVDFANGMYIVELVAESAGGNKTSKGVAFKIIPEIYEIKGKLPAAKPAVITWLDGGQTYYNFALSSGKNTNNKGITFSKDIDISSIEDGIVQIDIRATDMAGNVVKTYTSVYKDTTPPEVEVIEPLDTDIVNGETLIVFKAIDNVEVAKSEYVTPPKKGEQQKRTPIDLHPLTYVKVGTDENPIDDAMTVNFTDFAGNVTKVEAWKFNIDNESDLPRVEIHVPEEMQVITRDFTISGVVYDDDGESTIFYKIDDNAYQQIPGKGTSFSIDVPLSTMTDNEHTVSVYAVDLNGVKGLESTRTFRISLEEPKGAVELPTIDTTVKEIVKISGYASDKNGIAKVQVSLDNGNSYNDAVGTENWSYTVDTRAIPGGTQVVFLKITDKYGIQGLYSSLINIDNDAPELSIELSLDDSSTTGQLFISGSNYDKVGVTDLFVTIRNLEKTSRADKRNIRIDRIIGETIDLTNLENGFYNVEITAKDKAGNITNCSRNIHLNKNKAPVTVGILYPLNGEHKQGVFNIYGQSESESEIESLKLFIDDKLVSETTITDTGYFKFEVGPDLISEGTHTYHVDSVLKNGIKVSSREQTITYSPVGPWVTIDNFTYGDFATGRPYIRGQAGYSISEDELLYSKTKEATKEEKAAVAAKKVAKIELSFDNGKTFQVLSTSEKWMYRIENQDIPEGFHFFLVRATMENGETAITRCIIQIDNTSPNVRLISPAMGGRYNQNLDFSGLSNDDVQLEKVTLALRKGDKASYAVPAFIQGLYLDFHFWGASLFDIGAGLTFFDDNVRLQVQWGQFTQDQRDAVSKLFGVPQTGMRYGGNVFGLKLLANIFTLPFSFFLGRDWEWLSASFALGANFSLFTETNSGKPQFLSALLGQLEFPRVHLANMKAFRTFSFYTEFSLWFIPTDVSSQIAIQSVVPQIAFGIRVNVF